MFMCQVEWQNGQNNMTAVDSVSFVHFVVSRVNMTVQRNVNFNKSTLASIGAHVYASLMRIIIKTHYEFPMYAASPLHTNKAQRSELDVLASLHSTPPYKSVHPFSADFLSFSQSFCFLLHNFFYTII